jgi:hypothetical protein
LASPNTLALAGLMVIGLTVEACAGQRASAPSSSREVVTPSEVLAAPDSFLDLPVQVRGRVHIVREDTLGPCPESARGSCTSATSASLQLVTSGESPSGTTALDLYRPRDNGGEEPVSCKVIGTNQFDCGTFTPDTIAVVGGRILKHRIPTQQVGTSGGATQVIRYREVFVLFVRP